MTIPCNKCTCTGKVDVLSNKLRLRGRQMNTDRQMNHLNNTNGTFETEDHLNHQNNRLQCRTEFKMRLHILISIICFFLFKLKTKKNFEYKTKEVCFCIMKMTSISRRNVTILVQMQSLGFVYSLNLLGIFTIIV